MSRFTHLSWKSVVPGHVVEGVWFQPSRTVRNKTGEDGGYQLGELEHTDGTRTGFTMPTMLRQQLDATRVGSHVRIEYLGTAFTERGYEMMRFAVRVTPPAKSAR